MAPRGPFIIRGREQRAEFGARIQALRIARGMSVDELAAKIGCAASQLHTVERGDAAFAGNNIQRAASALGVTYEKLVDFALSAIMRPEASQKPAPASITRFRHPLAAAASLCSHRSAGVVCLHCELARCA
ncbi:MAG TPA: helix-turn-helix transcriptional regulator [Kofleriaceae bacterium]|nr:helix-turn-helix transcriptional regulator [Kofleriaceae bacterium]